MVEGVFQSDIREGTDGRLSCKNIVEKIEGGRGSWYADIIEPRFSLVIETVKDYEKVEFTWYPYNMEDEKRL